MGDDRSDLDLLTEPTRRAIVGMLAERPRRAGSRSFMVIGLVRLAGGVASLVDPDVLAGGLWSMQRTPPWRPPDSRS
jgi:hypothetical protein